MYEWVVIFVVVVAVVGAAVAVEELNLPQLLVLS